MGVEVIDQGVLGGGQKIGREGGVDYGGWRMEEDGGGWGKGKGGREGWRKGDDWGGGDVRCVLDI